MTTKNKRDTLTVRDIQSLILTVRGEKVILDSDLAALYGVPTRTLNQAVRRNPERFPDDFSFQLDPQEVTNLKSQFVTSSCDDNRSQIVTGPTHGGRRKLPVAFTEHGALMAANVLRSPKAVEMSVFIVRAFIRMRGALVSQYEMAARLEQIEKILLVHDTQLKDLFDTIRPLLLPPPDPPSTPIGFGVKEKPAHYGSARNRKAITLTNIQGLILTVRGEKVILDSDLATLYGVPTKALNQAVRRNPERFPSDFAFQLEPQEITNLKSQFVTGSQKHRDPRSRPVAFTEHGALMAANVLRSTKAVEMSVFIVRAFIRMRGALVSQYEMAARLEQIEKILLVHDTQLKDLFDTIRPLLLPPPDPPSTPIGFGVKEKTARYGSKARRKGG